MWPCGPIAKNATRINASIIAAFSLLFQHGHDIIILFALTLEAVGLGVIPITMTFALSLAMKRFLALLLVAALPLQGLATPITHVFPGENGHEAPVTLVEAHGGQQHDAGDDYSALLPHDDTVSCCIFAGFCYGTPGMIARFRFPLAEGFTHEPMVIALYSFTSFTPESPERPPLAIL